MGFSKVIDFKIIFIATTTVEQHIILNNICTVCWSCNYCVMKNLIPFHIVIKCINFGVNGRPVELLAVFQGFYGKRLGVMFLRHLTALVIWNLWCFRKFKMITKLLESTIVFSYCWMNIFLLYRTGTQVFITQRSQYSNIVHIGVNH